MRQQAEMAGEHAVLVGELQPWPSQELLESALRVHGLRISAGQHSVRIASCDHFVFQGFPDAPHVSADAQSVDALIADARVVSEALSLSKIRHRFEVYDADDRMTEYLHHDWPLKSSQLR